MRLLIYSHAFAPKIGGVETLVMSLATGLTCLKLTKPTTSTQVTVVTRTPEGQYNDASLSFPVVREPSLWQLLHLIRATDVIHLAGPAFLPMLLGILMRKPIVVEHSGYQAVCPNGLLLDERTKTACPGQFMAGHFGECWRCNAANEGRSRSLAMLLLTFPRRWMCQRAARNVAPTAHVGERLMLPHTVTIYHGVPCVPVRPSSEEQSFVPPVTFAYVGRLVSEKGLNLLLEAAGRLQAKGCDFRLKFIGDGPERSRLMAATDAMGLRPRATFTGYLEADNLERAMDDVTALVMPSIWEETAGLSAIEQMIRGHLVIAADIGGLGELVDGAGLKFPARDVGGLASCMKQVIDDNNLAKTLGKIAGERAQAIFGEERMLVEHLTLYRELLGTFGPSPVHVTEDK